MSATMLPTIFLLSCGGTGSRRSREGERAAELAHLRSSDMLRQLGGPALTLRGSDECQGFAFAQIRRPPHDSYVPLEGCSVTIGDTTRYVYRNTNGQLLVSGIDIGTAPERVRTVLDSLRELIAERFGPPSSCVEYRTTVAPLYAWDLDSIALSAWADSGLTYFRVGLEARASERICDAPLRRPGRQ